MTDHPQTPPRLVPCTGTVAHLDTPTTDRRILADHPGPWAFDSVPLRYDTGLDRYTVGHITRAVRRTDDTGRLCLYVEGEVEAHVLAEDGTLAVAASFTTNTAPVRDANDLLVVEQAILRDVVCGPGANSVFPGTIIRAPLGTEDEYIPEWTLQRRRNEWEDVLGPDGVPVTAHSVAEIRALHTDYSNRHPEETYRSARSK